MRFEDLFIGFAGESLVKLAQIALNSDIFHMKYKETVRINTENREICYKIAYFFTVF